MHNNSSGVVVRLHNNSGVVVDAFRVDSVSATLATSVATVRTLGIPLTNAPTVSPIHETKPLLSNGLDPH